MKMHNILKTSVALAILLALATANLSAQDAVAGKPAPVVLSYGVDQIVNLTKASVSEANIIAYIQNSGNNYGLDAAQIIYLKQQGVADAVVNAMINQRNVNAPAQTAIAVTAPATGAPATTTYIQPASSTAYVAPPTTYYYTYSEPYYYPAYSPGYYGWGFPPVSFSFGWGGGFHGGGFRGPVFRGGGGFHGGGGGGFHGGGGFRR
jgi:uncharacterized membrane protein YgcG